MEAAQKAVQSDDGTALLKLFRLGGDNAGHNTPAEAPRLRGTDGEQVTRFVLGGRRLLRDHYRKAQAERGADGRSRLFPLALPAMAQFRTTRRIVGRATMQAGDAGRSVADPVGVAADWRVAGSVWEIPYGALVPTGVRGLLAAGRCIASDGDAWEVARVIPVAALTGQVAGAAAAWATAADTTPDALEIGALQAALRLHGVRCRFSDV